MTNRTSRHLAMAVAVGLCLAASTAIAGDIHSNAGTKAFPFLKINVGARAVGMGGAFTGLADDASALYYNPAGVAALGETQWIGGYHNYFDDIQSGFLGMVMPLDEYSSLGMYASYLSYGEFIETDTNGTTLGTFTGGDMLLAGTFARQMSFNIKLGVTGKFIFEKVQDYSATGFAVDIGARYTDDRERFSAGVAVQNLGKQLSALGDEKYGLPLTLRGGISLRPRGLPITIVTDVIKPSDNDISFSIGGEYHEFKPFYMRMGWNSFGTNYRTEDSDDSWAGLALGFGFDYRRLHIAYAFAPGAELGDTHRITITGGLTRR